MGEDTNQIEQEIRDRRGDLGRNLEQLQEKARDLADWRTHYRDHSRVFLGLAFSAGLLLGLKAIPSARLNGVQFHEPDTSHDPYPPRQVGNWAPKPAGRVRRQFGDTWDQIADGLLRTASVAAINLVSDLVPGFSDQVGRGSRSR